MALPKVNLVVVGHKDHGKSTLIGRLLYDSKAVLEQKLQEITTELERSGKEFEFAFLLDSLEEERKGGLTIDIMHTPFNSKRYSYTIIDCPGHREFIKKMLTGASQADAAVLVVSAKEGIEDQTKQHAFLIKILGIQKLVVAVNKLDEVAYREGTYEKTCKELNKMLHSLGYEDAPTVPVSALNGDNVFARSKRMNWYSGSTLIDTLDETVTPSADMRNRPFRGCVQDVYEMGNEQMAVCKVETGTLRSGDLVSFNPSGKEGLVRTIEVFGKNVQEAKAGDSVGLQVEGAVGVKRGDVVSHLESRPIKAKRFIAETILFSDVELRTGDVLTIRCGTAEKKCKVQKILKEIDPVDLNVRCHFPEVLKEDGVGEIEFHPIEPLCVERYSDFPQLGRFVVQGRSGAVGAGIILEVN